MYKDPKVLRHEHQALYRLSLKVEHDKKDADNVAEYNSAFEKALVGNPDDLAEQKRNFDLPLWKSASSGDLALFQDCEQKGIDVEARGKFGETAMHACLLFWPRDEKVRPKYRKFLRYLIEKHPTLVNVQYSKEPYVGEHILHFAIVNNDINAIKMIVDAGGDIHAKAVGTFFKPYGNWFHGSYPLSFAAVSGNKAIVKYLLDKGADPFRQDDVLGMNVMHMTVVYNLIEMYDFILEWMREFEKKPGVDISRFEIAEPKSNEGFFEHLIHPHAKEDSVELEPAAANKKYGKLPSQHLVQSTTNFRRTPLTLAAELGKNEMFVHIIGQEKETMWRYGTVQASAYPLYELDTYPSDELAGRPSALELIVNISTNSDEDMERAKILDATPINQLIQQKWDEFGFYWYYGWFLLYFGWLIIFTLVAVNAPELYFLPVNRAALQLVVLIGALLFMAVEARDIYVMKLKYFRDRGSWVFFFLIWLFSILIVILTILEYGVTATPNVNQGKAVLTAIAIISAWTYMLFFLRGQKTVGVLVVMLIEMLFGDIMRWVVVYIILMFGFAAGFVAIFNIAPPGDPLGAHSGSASLSSQYDPNTTPNFRTFSSSVESLYKSLYGDFSSLGSYDGNYSTGMTIAMFVGYSILANILLVNVLIAMLNFTFSKIQERARLQWKREWASIILLIERRMPFFLRKFNRSGKLGQTLSVSRPTAYYIILEERIERPEASDPTEDATEEEEEVDVGSS